MAKGKINLFDVVPFVCEHITTVKKGDLSVITFPRFPKKFMQKLFSAFAKSESIHIQLDEEGTRVWDLIDGKRSVRDICNEIALSSGSDENYESRVALFISRLQENGFIKYKVAV